MSPEWKDKPDGPGLWAAVKANAIGGGGYYLFKVLVSREGVYRVMLKGQLRSVDDFAPHRWFGPLPPLSTLLSSDDAVLNKEDRPS